MTAVLQIGDVSVGAGEIVALLGGNGAGKTRLLETVLGFRPGRVSLFGHDATPLSVEQRVALGVGYVPEGRRVFAGLTVRENLEASSSLPAGERRHRVDEMLALFPMLGERPQARAWLLSGGQQQMLALARALMDRPRLLLLDEPTLGLAPLVGGRPAAPAVGDGGGGHGDRAGRAARGARARCGAPRPGIEPRPGRAPGQRRRARRRSLPRRSHGGRVRADYSAERCDDEGVSAPDGAQKLAGGTAGRVRPAGSGRSRTARGWRSAPG